MMTSFANVATPMMTTTNFAGFARKILEINMQSKEDLMNVRLTMLFTREALDVNKLMVVPLSPMIAVKEGTTSEATRSRSPSWCAAV